MFLLVLHLLISQVLDDISQIQWTHTKHQPSNPVVTPIFSPNNGEDGEFNSCLSEKTTQRLPQNPDELAFRDFSPWHRYRFFWTAICIYMCFFMFFPYTKIIKNPKYAGRGSNYSNICLKQKPFDHKVISAVPSSHPAPPESYVGLGSPPRMLVRGEGLGWTVGIPRTSNISCHPRREDCILGRGCPTQVILLMVKRNPGKTCWG